MARTRKIQNSFNAGEITPKLAGRTDIEKYNLALNTCENWSIMPLGGITRRPGLRFIAEVKDSTKKVRVIKFRFSTTQNYILEFGNLYMRVYRNSAQVQFGGGPFELVTPYVEADLPTLQFTQSADTLYITHSSYAQRKITRTADDAWTITTINFTPPPTYEREYSPTVAVTPGATTGNGITFTADAAFFVEGDVGRQIKRTGGGRAVITTVSGVTPVTTCTANILDDFPSTAQIPSGSWTLDGSPNVSATPSIKEPEQAVCTITLASKGFRTDEVGKYVHINSGIVKLTQITSQTVGSGPILKVLTSVTAAPGGAWTLEAESWTTANGFPRTTTFFESRLYFAGSNTFPGTFWGSKVGDFENFGRGTVDDASIQYTLASPLVDVIHWIYPLTPLMIGTVGGEFRALGGTNAPLTPTNVNVKNETSWGSDNIQPVRVGNSLLFIQHKKSRIRELTFDFDIDGYVSPDLTLLADHLQDLGTFERLDYAVEPFSIVYVVRSDGQLLQFTYKRDQNVAGWSRVGTGPKTAEVFRDVIEDVASIPHSTKTYNQVWVVVKRTLSGITKRYIEVFDPDLNTDSSLTRTPTGTKVSSVSGLSHLNGEVVDVVGDDGVQAQKTVSGGVVTLDTAADKIEIGLHYNSPAETLPPEPPGISGTLQGLAKRWARMNIRLYKTDGLKLGGDVISFRIPADLMDSGIGGFTGDKEVSLAGIDKFGKLTIEQTLPRPATVLALMGRLEVDDL